MVDDTSTNVETNDAGLGASRKRMTIFRETDPRVEVDHEVMEYVGMDATLQAGFGRLMEAGMSPGLGERAGFVFRESDKAGMSLVHGWFKSNYILPRHSHDSDCLYYVLSGELKMGSVILRKGDGVFVPTDKAYTYQAGPEGVEILEFRNTTQFHMHFKGNDEAHIKRMVDVVSDRAEIWQTETPPSA